MKFHEFVTSRRLKLNLNKKELAKKAKISDAYIKHIEDGIRIPKDMIILYNLADALQVDRDWFRDYAYLNRDHEKAVSYIDEQKVNESRTGDSYNTTNSLSSKEKELLALFRKVDEEERQRLVRLLQNGGAFSKSLVFQGRTYGPQHTLYKIVNEIKDKDDAFLKKMLDYIVAMVFIETHDQKSPLRELLTDMLKI
ncbi:helix-turn-helix domain-containing protein [candidate division KSB3 bacterium]|uniref:Helix-turn-helix domain-containing protein n=1 Tax=candidate division KSB3 bacterium TaxID=2044937 RepID=A0A9D5JYE8_9BACT|nr:helix-turn-helix domain-containing protein [candidate division KSB3 bacterium]MBD3326634.1 helix-turn-helix domain-containing protein [candidate division KSB3 bacterium]